MKNDSIKKNKLNNSAFTLVEVIATVVILGIILIIILTGYTKYVKNSKTKYDSEQTNLFIQAGKDYFNDNRNFLPTDKGKKSCVTLKTLIENKYIGKIYDSDKKPYSNDSKVCAVKVSLTKYSYTGKLLHYGETETEYEQGFHPKNFTISFTSSKQGEKNIVKMTIESEYKITSYKYIIHKVTTEEGNETDKTVLVKGPISVSEKDKVSVDIKLDNTGTYYIQAESYNEKNQRVVAKSTNFTQNVTKMDCSNSVSVTEGTTNWTNKDIRNKINVNSDTVKYYYFTVKNSYNDYIVEDTRQINTSDSNGVFYHNITASDGETKNVYYEIIPYDKNGKNNNCVIRTSNFKIDKVKPTCQVKSSNTEWTNQNVTVNAQCQDRDSKCIQSEKVKVINSDHVGEYVVTFNDNAGNTVNCESQYIKVDKTAPSVNVTTTNNFKSTTQKATLKCSDNNGIIGYYFGTTAPTSSTTYNTVTSTKDLSIEETINSNGKYYFYCKDVAGNSKGATKEYINYTVNNMYQNQTGSTYTIGNYTQSSNNTYIISKGTTLPLTEIYTIPTGSNPNRFVGITNGNPSTTAVTPSTASIVLNEEMTFTTWFTRNVMYFKYKTNGGTIQKTTHNADNTTTYNWGVDNNGYITLNNSNNFTNYRYGTTSINLYDYNNRNAMYIYKTGYTTTTNQEWICESGCKENNQVFSHGALTYSSSNDICNAENSDCTAVVKVNWKRQTYNINYELNGGTNNSSNPINYNVDSNNITINSPTRGDYTFEGWTEQIKDLVWHSGFINLNTGMVETNSDNPSSYYTDMIKLNSGTKYTLGGYGSYSGSAIRWRIYDLNGAYKKNVTATEYTPDADCYVRILFYNAPTSAQRTGTIITSTPGKNATITKGSTHNRLYTGSWSKDSSKLNVELSETSYIYDGNNKEPIVIVKDGNEILVRDKDYTLTYSNNKNAGTAKVIITGKGTYNNTTKTKYIGTKEVTFIINRKPIAFPTCSDKTYTAKEQTLFEAHTSGEYTNAVLKGTNVNSYTTDLTPAANYEWSSGSNVTSKRTLTCKIVKSNTTTSLSAITKTYTGSAQAASGATAKLNSTNEAISGGSYTYTYYSGESCGTALSGAPKNAGKYSVKATLTGTSNYNTSTSGCVKYTMNQKKPTMNISPTSGTLTYGTNGTITVTTDSDGPISCSTSDGNVVGCSTDNTTKKITVTPKANTADGKKATITVKQAAGTNYSAADNETYSVTVNRKTITCPTATSSQTKIYTGSSIASGVSCPTGSTAGGTTSATNVGSYSHTCEANSGYKFASACSVAWSINYAKITFNKGTCDSISGSTSLYAKKNTTSLYTGAQNSTAGTIPSASKTGYTFNGWYTGTSGGSKVIDSSKNVIASISNWTDANKKWLLTGNSNVNAHCTYSATPTITKTDFNTFSYSATGADKYFVSAANTSTAPTASSTWVTTKSKTISSAGTYYVWAQNSAGAISTNKASITAYTISRSATNGTLTSRYDSTSSSTGTAFTNNTVMLKNTDVWAKCEANTGYHVTDTSLKHGSTAIAGGSGTFKVTANETLSCAPTANTYTVQYCQGNNSDTAGSKCSSTTSSHAYGTAKKLTAYSSLGFTAPKGWEFAGWSTSQTGTSVSTVNSVKLTDQANVSNLTSTNGGTVKLHAIFKRTVKFNSGASCGTTSTATQYYNPYKNAGYITAVSFPAPKLIIADKGWSVLGYRGDKTASTEDFSVTTTAVDKTPGSMRHDITNGASTTLNLYAVYKRTITAYHGKAKNNSTTLTQYVNCSSNTVSAVTLPAPNTSSFTADTKWAAVGYRGDTTAGEAGLAVTTASASLKPAYNVSNTLYAVYSRSLTMKYNGNNNNEGSTASHTSKQYYNTNGSVSTVTFTTAANGFIRYGYNFSKWANDSTSGAKVAAGSAAAGFTPGVDSTSLTKTMYAAWVEKTHTMEVNPNGGKWNDTTDTSSVSYVVSNRVYATTKPTRTGYKFEGWSNQTKVSPSKDDPSFSGDTFNDDDVYPYNNVANAATKYYYGGSSVSSTAKHDVISRGTGLGSTFANSGNIITIGKYANSDYESGSKARSPFGSYAFAIYNPPAAKITAGAKPGFGGFYQLHTPTAGHTYLHVIGVICGNDTKGNTTYLHFNHNSLGTGGNDSAEDGYGWVTQNRCMKTNETESAWKIYMYKIKYGTGDIGTFGHVYFSDKANNGTTDSITSGAHFSAYVGYSMVYDITSSDSAFGQVNSTKTSKLTANWSVGVYQIKFNEQGGTKSSSSNICMYEKYNNGYYLWSSMESKYQITTSQAASGWGAPSKPGYTFAGYYTETNGGGTQIITSAGKLASGVNAKKFTANDTIYAKWAAGEYKIKFDKQEGSGGNDYMFEKYGTGFNKWSTFPSGDEVTTSKALNPPSRSGHTFHGYYTETNGKGKQIITASGKLADGVTSKEFTAATTIYAYWASSVVYYKCKFTYNYVTDSNAYCRLPNDIQIFYGSWTSSAGFTPWDGCHAATDNGVAIGLCKKNTILNKGTSTCSINGYKGWNYYNPGGADGKCKCTDPSFYECATTTSWAIYTSTSKPSACYLGNSACSGGAKCSVSCEKQ